MSKINMRLSGALVILSVLVYSTAVSSTSSQGFGVIDSLSDVESDDVGVFTPDQISCTSCNMLMLIMKKKFKSTTREVMLDRVLHECNSLSILSETCANMVFNYFDFIYNFVKHQLQSNEICGVSGICVGTDWRDELDSVAIQVQHDGFYCEECIKITKHIQNSLFKGTEAQFKALLTNFCHSMPIFKLECDRFVDQYSHVVYVRLKSVKLEKFCSFTGVCNTNKGKELQLISNNVGRESMNCGFCKDIIKNLKEAVREQYDINAILKVVCENLMTQNLIDKCHKMIDNHTALVIELISKNAPHQEICRKLNMCLLLDEETNFDLEMPQPLSVVRRGKKPKKKKNLKCKICKLAIQKILSIAHHGGKEDIRHALEKACHMLGPLRHKCEKIVTAHSDQIADMILKKTPPKLICKMIGMCRSALDEDYEMESEQEQEQWDEEYVRDNEQLEGPNPSVNSGFGALCQMMLSSIKRVFDTQDKRHKMIDAILLTCNTLPSLIQIPCHTIVQDYGTEFLHSISQINPRYICHILDASVNQTVVEDLSNAFNEYLNTSSDLSDL